MLPEMGHSNTTEAFLEAICTKMMLIFFFFFGQLGHCED